MPHICFEGVIFHNQWINIRGTESRIDFFLNLDFNANKMAEKVEPDQCAVDLYVETYTCTC